MRKIYAAEIEQRGCHYCEKRVLKWDRSGGFYRSHCPHTRCPYRVLDKYESYKDYMNSEDSKRLFSHR